MNIVFLPKNIGFVKNTIVIQTNVGGFLYQVSGSGIYNPYKIEPLINTRVLSNELYNRSISIFNPHYHTIQISEVFTTGGFLQLNLPSTHSNLSTIKTNSSGEIWVKNIISNILNKFY